MDITQTNLDKYQDIDYRHGGNINIEAKRLGVNANKLMDASASIVPFTPPKELINSVKKALHKVDLNSYPDRSHYELRTLIGSWHDIDPEMVLPGNGAAELFTWVARDASNAGLSLLPTPGFGDYARALECWDGSYKEVPLPLTWNSFTPQKFPLRSNANVAWITNPHNPTGQLWTRASLEKLLNQYDLVICDEAFLPLVPEGERNSLIPLVKTNHNLVVVRSLTKLFAIAGLRLGYAIGSKTRLNRWQQWRDPWPVNGLSIAAGKAIMSNKDVFLRQVAKVQKWIQKEGPWLQGKINELPGLISHPSSVNFFLIQGEKSLIELREQLSKNLILVRDCNSFVGLGDNWLRISLQKKLDNRRIFKTMKNILKNNHL